MSFTTRGFTLLEMLIALMVASIILIGVAGFFNQVLKAREVLREDRESFSEIAGFVELLSADVRCATGSLSVEDSGRRITFSTTHTLMYGGSREVQVSYYVEEEGGKSYVVREESCEGEVLKIPLSDGFKKLRFSFEDLGYYLVKVSFSYAGRDFSFSSRSVALGK